LTETTTSLPAGPVDDTDLVSEAQRDPSKFTALYDRYLRPIYRYLYSRVGNASDAEDLTAQTFLSAFEALPRYRHQGHFSAWLFTIARNRVRDHYRPRTVEMPLNESQPNPADDPLVQVVRSDQLAHMAKAIRSLSEGEKELIRLRFAAELSFSEIGECLGKREEAVKKSFYRLMTRLQRQLEERHE